MAYADCIYEYHVAWQGKMLFGDVLTGFYFLEIVLFLSPDPIPIKSAAPCWLFKDIQNVLNFHNKFVSTIEIKLSYYQSWDGNVEILLNLELFMTSVWWHFHLLSCLVNGISLVSDSWELLFCKNVHNRQNFTGIIFWPPLLRYPEIFN